MGGCGKARCAGSGGTTGKKRNASAAAHARPDVKIVLTRALGLELDAAAAGILSSQRGRGGWPTTGPRGPHAEVEAPTQHLGVQDLYVALGGRHPDDPLPDIVEGLRRLLPKSMTSMSPTEILLRRSHDLRPRQRANH